MKRSLWYLYDFANSFASVVLIFYYPLVLSEMHVNQAWLGIPASIATVLLFIFLPRMGHFSDNKKQRMFLIRALSIVMILSLIVIAVLTKQVSSINYWTLIILTVLYTLFQFAFQGSLAFYSAQLNKIDTDENTTKVSGAGLAYGQLGNAVAIGLISYTIAHYQFLGFYDKSLAFMLGATLFLFLSLPYLLTRESIETERAEIFSYKRLFMKIKDNKGLMYFLIGYSLLADGILTFQVYLTIFMKETYGLTEPQTINIGIASLLSVVFTGLTISTFIKLCKNKYRALIVGAVAYLMCFVLLAIVPSSFWMVLGALIFAGIAYGLFFAVSRAYYSEIIPIDSQAEYFSIYSIFERAASIVGPLIWLIVFNSLFMFEKVFQYRGAVFSLAIICFIGIIFLIKSKKEYEKSSNF